MIELRILFIRHGDPDYSIDSLTPKGWVEAELLSEKLSHTDIDDFYVSPLGRAKDTAKYTLDKVGKTAEVLPWLEEFRGRIYDLPDNPDKIRGPWDLMPGFWTKNPNLYDKDKWLDDPMMSAIDTPQIFKETCDGIDALLKKYGYERNGMVYNFKESSHKTIALFCHLGISMATLSYLLGAPAPILWQGLFMPPSSVTTVITEERQPGIASWRAFGVGDISHLYKNGEPPSYSGFFSEKYN